MKTSQKRVKREDSGGGRKHEPLFGDGQLPNATPTSNPFAWVTTMLAFVTGMYAFLQHVSEGLGILVALLRAERERLEEKESEYSAVAVKDEESAMEEDDAMAVADDAVPLKMHKRFSGAFASPSSGKRVLKQSPEPALQKRKAKSSPSPTPSLSPSPSRSSFAVSLSPSPSRSSEMATRSPSRERSRARSRDAHDTIVAYSEPYGYRMRMRHGKKVPRMPADPPPAPEGHNGTWYVVTVGRQVGIWPTWEMARVHVDGLGSNCHQSYSTWAKARAAFQDARRGNRVVKKHD